MKVVFCEGRLAEAHTVRYSLNFVGALEKPLQCIWVPYTEEPNVRKDLQACDIKQLYGVFWVA